MEVAGSNPVRSTIMYFSVDNTGLPELNMTKEKIASIAMKKIYQLIPSEKEADYPGEIYAINKNSEGVWLVEYRIPLIEFSDKGARPIFETIDLKIKDDGSILSVKQG